MLAVLGAGPHGRQIAHDLNGVLYDDNLPGYQPILNGAKTHPWVVGAVWPAARRYIAERANRASLYVPYEGGRVVFPTAFVGIDVELGRHVHVLPQAAVSHGCQLGDFVTVATGASLCGEVTVDDDVFIGAGAVVIHGGIKLGRGAVIGAGVVVKQDVAPGEVLR